MKNSKQEFQDFIRNPIYLIITVLVLGLMVIGIVFFMTDDSDSDVSPKQSELTKLVNELSKDGDSLVPEDYYGYPGIWGHSVEIAGKRDYYSDSTDAKKVTLMVYMIGSSAESEHGYASEDIQKMINSRNRSPLQIVLQTGGAREWKHEQVSSLSLQRFLIQRDGDKNEDPGLMTLVDEEPLASMCTRQTLCDFIQWSVDNYPADRYMLLLWDQGKSTMKGFGDDELFPGDALTMEDMAGAVADSGIKLDGIFFDASYTGTLETALLFEPVADYMIGCQGDTKRWCYEEYFLGELAMEPDMSMPELGARIIDEYGEFYQWESPSVLNLDADANINLTDTNDGAVTISLVDLTEIPHLYQQYETYSKNIEELSESNPNEEQEITDLVDYIERHPGDGDKELIQSVFSAVKYRVNTSIPGAYGLSCSVPKQETVVE